MGSRSRNRLSTSGCQLHHRLWARARHLSYRVCGESPSKCAATNPSASATSVWLMRASFLAWKRTDHINPQRKRGSARLSRQWPHSLAYASGYEGAIRILNPTDYSGSLIPRESSCGEFSASLECGESVAAFGSLGDRHTHGLCGFCGTMMATWPASELTRGAACRASV